VIATRLLAGARQENAAALASPPPSTLCAVAWGLQPRHGEAAFDAANITNEGAMAIEEEVEPAVAEPAPKKRRSPLVIAMAVALLLVSGVCAYALFALVGHDKPSVAATGKAAATSKADKNAPDKNAPEYFLPLDPAFVVNFRDDDSMRYLQIGVTLMAHDQGALDTVKSVDPVVRNALVMLFSRQDYSILSDPNGKQKLQAEALDAVRKIVASRTGKPGVDALYFTSFVMQ
jgi:flagellar protein FliL